MKSYNLSKIMKRAWELVKKTATTISSALKRAWKEAKNMSEYVIDYFDNQKGYKIEWPELEKIIDTVYPDGNQGNGWYQKWNCNNWVKGDKDRTYISLKEYRNFKLRAEHALGYYDNKLGAYIISDKYKKVTDVIALFKSKNQKGK